MKLTITKLTRNQVQTKYGQKEKLGLQFQEKSNVWIDSFVGNWNKDWKIGEVIEVKADQFKSREYNGKTYWTLQAPPESKGGFQASQALAQEIKKLEERIEALENAVFETDDKNFPPEPMQEEMEKIQAQDNAEVIPF